VINYSMKLSVMKDQNLNTNVKHLSRKLQQIKLN